MDIVASRPESGHSRRLMRGNRAIPPPEVAACSGSSCCRPTVQVFSRFGRRRGQVPAAATLPRANAICSERAPAGSIPDRVLRISMPCCLGRPGRRGWRVSTGLHSSFELPLVAGFVGEPAGTSGAETELWRVAPLRPHGGRGRSRAPHWSAGWSRCSALCLSGGSRLCKPHGKAGR